MKTTVTGRNIWRIAYPIIIGSIAQNLITVTDTAFLGRLGEIELGAAALGGIFYLAIIMIGQGLAIGTQIIVARRKGEGTPEKVGPVMEHSFGVLILISFLLFFLIRAFTPGFFESIISSYNVLQKTNEFISLRSYGLVFAFVNLGFNAFYIGTARTGIISWSTLIMAVINILFDYLLIFGKGGFPEMGIRGAAIASVIAEGCVTLFFILLTLKNKKIAIYNLFVFSPFNSILLRRILRVSTPVMIQNFISIAVWFLFFVFVERLGETELAVSNIIRSVYVILMIPIWGFASASNTMVSFLIGNDRKEEVLSLIFRTSFLCFLMVSLFSLIALIFPEQILSVYTSSDFLIGKSLPVLKVVSVTVILYAYAMVFFFGVTGIGNTLVSLIIEVVVVMIYIIVTYLLTNVYSLSIEWVWTAEFVYGFFMFLFSFLYLKFGDWKNSRWRL